MNLPVAGKITQYFGPTFETRDSGAYGFQHFNKGIDIAADIGTPIKNIVPGTVIWVGDAGDGWGVSVKVRLDDGRIVNYGHMQENSPTVRIGQRLTGGEVIGKVGNTGASTGPHLSFDVLDKSGNPVDPSDILGFNAAIDNRTGKPWKVGAKNTESGGKQTAQQMLFPKPNKDVLDAMKKRRDLLWQQIEQTMSSDDPEAKYRLSGLMQEWQDLVLAIDLYEKTGYTTQSEANAAFTQAIALGELDLSRASQLFTEWANKEAAARSAADQQISSALEFNRWAAEKKGETTYGYNYRPSYTLVPPTFEEAYKRWSEALGVGEPPSVSDVDTLAYLPEKGGEVYTEAIVPGYTASPPGAGQKVGQQASDKVKNLLAQLFGNATKTYSKTYNKPWSQLTDAEKESLLEKEPLVWAAGIQSEEQAPQTSQNVSMLPGKQKSLKELMWEQFAEMERKYPPTQPFDPSRYSYDPLYLEWKLNQQKQGQYGITLDPKKASYPEDAKQGGGKKKKGKSWWQKLGIPGLATGGQNIQPGMYVVGEQGPEHAVMPGGQVMPIGQNGPELAMVNQPGVDVLPADVPPEQAYLYAKFKRLMQEDETTREAREMMEQQQRANDPQLQEKVIEAIKNAIASVLAANPPETPRLVGNWTRDPWEHLRPLSGIGPDGQPVAASSGMPVPSDQNGMPMQAGSPQVPGVPGMAPGSPLQGVAGV